MIEDVRTSPEEILTRREVLEKTKDHESSKARDGMRNVNTKAWLGFDKVLTKREAQERAETCVAKFWHELDGVLTKKGSS